MKKEETAVATTENEQPTAVATRKEESLNEDQLVAMLDEFEGEVKLTGTYFNPEMGEVTKCWYTGRTKMTASDGSGNKVSAVRLLLQDGNTVVTASTVIVGVCEELPVPSPLSVTKTGEKKLSGGKKLHEFEISKLVGLPQ